MTSQPLTIFVEVLMDLSRPIVQVACVCETVVVDKGDSPTIVRITDIFTVEIPDNVGASVPIGFPVTIFLRLKFLDKNQNGGTISIQAQRPDGSLGSRQNIVVEKGVHENLHHTTHFHVLKPQRGTYRFDVFWNDELLTTIPIQVDVKQMPSPGAARAT